MVPDKRVSQEANVMPGRSTSIWLALFDSACSFQDKLCHFDANLSWVRSTLMRAGNEGLLGEAGGLGISTTQASATQACANERLSSGWRSDGCVVSRDNPQYAR